MTNKINISIPKPCGEKWDAMTTSEKGKFCDSCQKNIIDFTSFSDKEILKYYNQNSKICGRFHSNQINRNLILPKEKSSIWLAFTSAIISFLGLGSPEIYAQESIKTEQTDKKQLNNSTAIEIDRELPYHGIVYDENKIPIPGVNVMIKGTQKSTSTDINGKFTIEAKKREVLVFSSIGFVTTEKKVSTNRKINLIIKLEGIIMGEVIIRED